jgi:secreted PhoX family phosphatase
MNRRTLLLQLLGVGIAGMGGEVGAIGGARRGPSAAGSAASGPFFRPLNGTLPLLNDGLSAKEQRSRYADISLEDRLLVPEGFRSELLISWGDRLAEGRFGFNNDDLAFTPLGENRALLTVNFEYISPRTWCANYAEVMGTELPFTALQERLAVHGGSVDVTTLPAGDPLRAPVLAVARAAMNDLGIGVVALVKDTRGRWRHQPGRPERRITGLSGLDDPSQRLHSSGPAAAVFRRRQRMGYDDGLGDRVIGSFANCAGGQTPWGTVLSAEENFQSQVVERVFADGSSPPPTERPFRFDGQRLDGLGNPFGMAGNKYGWMVELNPQRPELPAVKHTWLGRFRHEAVAVQARTGEPLRLYSGCDRHGGHLYRFVSEGVVKDPADPANSRLMEQGRLEAARFSADGTGRWIPLAPSTPLAPVPPSHFERYGLRQPCLLPHSDRSQPGAESLASDSAVAAYLTRHRTLADLYLGSGEEQQGAILIDAHLAANAVGATAAARPEDTAIDPRSGDLLVSFTAAGSDGDGRADPAIFHGPGGQAGWPHGWLMRLHDDAAGFRWQIVATGGTPWQGGMGFSNPDNLAIDRGGNVWMVTDRSTGSSLDVFGNNSCWVFPASGASAGTPLLFATGPMECELSGPCFDAAERTLFLAVQHPGEEHGTHRRGMEDVQTHTLRDRDGRPFDQVRRVPLGSNWPSTREGQGPRPGVVAIQRRDGQAI